MSKITVVLWNKKPRQWLLIDEGAGRVVGQIRLSEERQQAGCPPWVASWDGQDGLCEVGVCFFATLEEATEATLRGYAEVKGGGASGPRWSYTDTGEGAA